MNHNMDNQKLSKIPSTLIYLQQKKFCLLDKCLYFGGLSPQRGKKGENKFTVTSVEKI